MATDEIDPNEEVQLSHFLVILFPPFCLAL